MNAILNEIKVHHTHIAVGSASPEGLKLYSKFPIQTYGEVKRYYFN